MNEKERKKIREKHARGFGKPRCQYCLEPFPCDAIKVLDAYEKEIRKNDIHSDEFWGEE